MLAEVRAFLDLSRERHSYSANTLRAIQEDLLRFSSYLVTNLGRPAELGDFNREQIADFLCSEGLRPVGVRTLLRRQTSLRVFARYLRQYHPDGDFASPEAITVPGNAAGRRASGSGSLTAEQIEAVQAKLARSASVHARRDAAIISLSPRYRDLGGGAPRPQPCGYPPERRDAAAARQEQFAPPLSRWATPWAHYRPTSPRGGWKLARCPVKAHYSSAGAAPG